MAIKTVKRNGKECFDVFVARRSKTHSNVRVQRAKMGIATLAEAKKIEKQMMEEVLLEVHEKENLGVLFKVLLGKWEVALAKGTGSERPITKSTAEDYVLAIKKHMPMLMDKEAEKVTRNDVRQVFAAMTQDGKAATTKKKLKNAINGLYRWGIDCGILSPNTLCPSYGIKFSREEAKKPEILTIEEIRKFLDLARSYNHPWYPIWAMAFHTGMRSGELHALLWTDIDWENRLITISKSYCQRGGRIIKETKGGYWREVPINDELMDFLKGLKAEAQTRSSGRENVLPRFRDWDRGMMAYVTRTFLEGIGLRSVKFHALRACFATQLIRNGVPPGVVMKICGWKELKTMQRYIRLAGIEIMGATDSLSFIRPKDAMGKVVELFGSR